MSQGKRFNIWIINIREIYSKPEKSILAKLLFFSIHQIVDWRFSLF